MAGYAITLSGRRLNWISLVLWRCRHGSRLYVIQETKETKETKVVTISCWPPSFPFFLSFPFTHRAETPGDSAERLVGRLTSAPGFPRRYLLPPQPEAR